MYEGAVQDLIDELGRLPGIGPKSAQRIAFHLLAAEEADVERLASTLIRVKREVKFCAICGNVAEADICRICGDVRIRELLVRLRDGVVTELILATDPNLEGEATATYLARMLNPMGLTVTRLASGLPVGGDLEYADEVTLGRAFSGRRRISA